MADNDREKDLTPRAKRLLEALPIDGSPVGNTHLSKKLGISKEELLKTREELLQNRLASRAKGRGGATRRILRNSRAASDAPDDAIQSLAKRTSRQAREQMKLRKQVDERPGAALENKLWLLLYRLQPQWMTTERDPKITVASDVPSPDAIALFERWGVVAECKSGESDAFQLEGLETVNEARNALKATVKRLLDVEHLVSLLAVRKLSEVSQRVRNRANELRIGLIDERRIDYYLRLERETGLGMANMFWGQTFPSLVSPERIKVPALRLKIGHGRYAFLFSANAHDLLVRAFVSHRELHDDATSGEPYKAYQRMLRKQRLGRISEYILKYGSFPTPIVVTFAESAGDHFDLAEQDADAGDRVRIGTLHLPRKPASIQVIDGQHRLFGYTRVAPDPAHVVHVIAYKEPMPSDRDPAEMFVEINSEQKPVPQGLLWELYPDIYQSDHTNFHKAIISEAMQRLITTGSAKGLVSHISSGVKGPITFATLCNEINRSPLISKNGGLVAQLAAKDDEKKKQLLYLWTDTLFSAMRECGNNKPGVNENFVYSNVGFVPLFRIFSRLLVNYSAKQGARALTNRSELSQTLTNYLSPIYANYSKRTSGDLRNLRSQRVGESGFGETEDEMTNIIQFEYEPDFPARGSVTRVAQLAHEMAYSMNQLNRKGLSSGKMKGWLFPTFDYLEFQRRFQKLELNQDSFAITLNVLYKEIVEGGGGKKAEEGSRLAQLLGLTNIVDHPAIRMLDNLRNYWDHNLRVLKPEKRQDAISALRGLTGKDELADVNEMSAGDFEIATTKIIIALNEEVLRAAHAKISV